MNNEKIAIGVLCGLLVTFFIATLILNERLGQKDNLCSMEKTILQKENTELNATLFRAVEGFSKCYNTKEASLKLNEEYSAYIKMYCK